ncbi:MAG: hypothetical protein BKP49_10495 [Treponema sp. CETP13]|nr:MAG: hypothetical protein BKP49_10495 [Treponema sp. CETP13]
MTANETKLKKDVLEAKNTQREVEKIVDRIEYKDREVESEESKKQKKKYKHKNESFMGLLIVSLITNFIVFIYRITSSIALRNEFVTFWKALYSACVLYINTGFRLSNFAINVTSSFNNVVTGIIFCLILNLIFIAIMLGILALIGFCIYKFFSWCNEFCYNDIVTALNVVVVFDIIILFADWLVFIPVNLFLLFLLLQSILLFIRSQTNI